MRSLRLHHLPGLLALATSLAGGCAGERPFPLREPLKRDPDQQPFTPMPQQYVSPFAWDGAKLHVMETWVAGELVYSARNADIGSTRDAWRAGTYAARNVTASTTGMTSTSATTSV